MQLLDRFSTHVREVLAKSIRLATELKNNQVEPVHIFFSLFNQKGSVAGEIISRFKLNPQTLEQAIFSLTHEKSIVSPKQATSIPLSPAAKIAVEKALLLAQENHHNYIGTEHLLAGLIRVKDPVINEVLHTNKVKMTELEKQLNTVLANASQFPHLTEAAEVVERIQENLGEFPPPNTEIPPPPLQEYELKKNKKKQTALDFFATNLTNEEAQKNIDPVIGREQELHRLIQILCRRTKNNPVLLGDPGVGKTAIVEGLAKRILTGDVPDILLNKKIYALDMGMLIAGTIYRGEFEGRLKQVIEEVTTNPDIILFIDEIHNIVGAGSNQGTMDAANILKPALSRGQIRCIGATTPQEFKKYIESDPALERRFQPLYVKEPSVEDTICILRGIKSNYEAHHRIQITEDAINAAAKLADRYVSNKFLPDKAIDLLDETAAAKRLTIKTQVWQTKISRAKQKLEKIILAKEEAAAQDKFSEAVKLKDEEEKLRAMIKKLEKENKSKKIKLLTSINAEDVIKQIAQITGTSPTELFMDEPEQLLLVANKLKELIIGQDQVIDEVVKLIRQAKLGISSQNRPLASFLFIGDSGVGKTELAKTLATVLYPGRDALVKLDMSEFNESFGVSKLLGSPAGYVGYKEQNQFTDRVKINPHCIIVFDEIDKAHRDVTKLLLQILENGEITDSTGKKISLKHAIIVLTTTFGAEEIKKGVLGFGENNRNYREKINQLTTKLKEHFSPEIINRLDKVCLFNPLTLDQFIQIAQLELKNLNQRIEPYHTQLVFDTEIVKKLLTLNREPFENARDVKKFVRTEIEHLISEMILNKKLKDTYHLTQKSGKFILK